MTPSERAQSLSPSGDVHNTAEMTGGAKCRRKIYWGTLDFQDGTGSNKTPGATLVGIRRRAGHGGAPCV